MCIRDSIAVIFDETEHGHVHHFCHFDRFGDDHGDELLQMCIRDRAAVPEV